MTNQHLEEYINDDLDVTGLSNRSAMVFSVSVSQCLLFLFRTPGHQTRNLPFCGFQNLQPQNNNYNNNDNHSNRRSHLNILLKRLHKMSYDPEKWTVSSNDVLSISIADDDGYTSFKPAFTYPIFGDSEQIFGYKDLKINLAFHYTTFLPFLKVTYSEKLNDEVDDVKDKMLEFLPASTVVDDEQLWVETFKKEKVERGELIAKLDEYAVYKYGFDNEFAVELNKRLQILVLMFIEAGSYIDTSDSLWSLFVMRKDDTIIGFTTSYSYFKYNGGEEFDSNKAIKRRNKISQFVILPNHQNGLHGSQLYQAVINYWLADPEVQEICVEDPNEKFDDLRYRNDFKRLFEEGVLSNLPSSISKLDEAWFVSNAASHKLELNQFKKLVEMGYLYNENVKLARLVIKKRLYIKNRDGLSELDKALRNDKLQTAYEGIRQDYTRILDALRLHHDERQAKRVKV